MRGTIPLPVAILVALACLVSTVSACRGGGGAKSEAADTLDKMLKGAAYYFTSPRVTREGSKLDCQFPVSEGATPAATCCGSGDGFCQAQPDSWNKQTWAALAFQLNDRHRCVYSFESNGKTRGEAEATAIARCDVDCNGVFSTYKRVIHGSASCETVTVPPSILIENENE